MVLEALAERFKYFDWSLVAQYLGVRGDFEAWL